MALSPALQAKLDKLRRDSESKVQGNESPTAEVFHSSNSKDNISDSPSNFKLPLLNTPLVLNRHRVRETIKIPSSLRYSSTPSSKIENTLEVKPTLDKTLSLVEKLKLLGIGTEDNAGETVVEITLPKQLVSTKVKESNIDKTTLPPVSHMVITPTSHGQPKIESHTPISAPIQKHEITYDQLDVDQKLAVTYAQKGISFCLIGGAGYGKTTTTKIISSVLSESGLITALGHSTKNLASHSPSIVFVSFTNPAVANIKSTVPDAYKRNCLTIHKLTEFSPIYSPREDEPDKMTLRFEPQRNALNPIKGLSHVVVEESGTVNLDLSDTLFSAIENQNVVYIFIGDLQQLPPAFGDGILGYKMLELPIVQLKTPHRTSEDSAIKTLAFRIQEGKPISDKELDAMSNPKELEFWRYPHKMGNEETNQALGKHFAKLVKAGDFNPMEDVLLVPYNKLVGTIELGRYIAQAQNELLDIVVHEIIAGFERKYYAVGDLVYYNKRKCRIIDIVNNGEYLGKQPAMASKFLDRWGIMREELSGDDILKQHKESKARFESMFSETMDNFTLDQVDGENDSNSRKNLSSHVITLVTTEEENEIELIVESAGDVNSMYFAHTLTVYKSQGSEWGRVFCLFHQCHAKQIVRETLYTACTRAREYLKVYCVGEKSTSRKYDATFYKGMINQRIPGDTLDEKLEFFKHKMRVELLKIELTTGKKFGIEEDEPISADNMKLLIKTMLEMKKTNADGSVIAPF